MTTNKNGTVILTEPEARALAILIAARKLEDVYDWLDWEDVGMLDLAGWEQVGEMVRGQSSKLFDALGTYETFNDIDAREILGRVTP